MNEHTRKVAVSETGRETVTNLTSGMAVEFDAGARIRKPVVAKRPWRTRWDEEFPVTVTRKPADPDAILRGTFFAHQATGAIPREVANPREAIRLGFMTPEGDLGPFAFVGWLGESENTLA